MKTIWLVERDFDPNTDDLIAALETMNVDLRVFKKRPFEMVDFASMRDELQNSPVMTYGSVNFIWDFQRQRTAAVPGHYATMQHYLTTRYYHHYHDFLLNPDHVILTAGSALHRDFTAESFEYVFIRPDRADKPFTGQVVPRNYIKKTINKYLGFESLHEHDLILFADPQKVVREARILVVGGEVITGSLYGKKKTYRVSEHLPRFLNFARSLELNYIPDGAFSIDLAEIKSGEIKIAELSAFSCMGLYDMNKRKVAETVDAQVQKEWKIYNDEIEI